MVMIRALTGLLFGEPARERPDECDYNKWTWESHLFRIRKKHANIQSELPVQLPTLLFDQRLLQRLILQQSHLHSKDPEFSPTALYSSKVTFTIKISCPISIPDLPGSGFQLLLGLLLRHKVCVYPPWKSIWVVRESSFCLSGEVRQLSLSHHKVFSKWITLVLNCPKPFLRYRDPPRSGGSNPATA